MSTLSTHFGETIGIILLWTALIAAVVWFLKYKEIKRGILNKQVDNIQKNTEALRINFDDLCVTNSFTALLDKTFRAENWTIVPQTQLAVDAVQITAHEVMDAAGIQQHGRGLLEPVRCILLLFHLIKFLLELKYALT